MTTTDAARQREDFLARLDAAMQSVPHGIATEVRAGIVEELAGLDAVATAARITQLGDPAVIAREAQSEAPAPAVIALPSQVAVQAAPQQKESFARSRGFAITAALVFAFGAFVVPVVGWFVGAVMVAASARWQRWEKILAIVLPLAAIALSGVVTWIIALVTVPDASIVPNPLVPSGLALWHSSILLVFLLIPLVGGWLLWRLRRR